MTTMMTPTTTTALTPGMTVDVDGERWAVRGVVPGPDATVVQLGVWPTDPWALEVPACDVDEPNWAVIN